MSFRETNQPPTKMYRSLCIALVLFVVSGSTFNWYDSSEDRRILRECRKSNGKPKKLSQDVNSTGTIGNWTSSNGPHSLDCFTACYMEKLKWYDDNGTLSEAVKKIALDNLENGDEVVRQLQECAFLPSADCKKKADSFDCTNNIVAHVAREKMKKE